MQVQRVQRRPSRGITLMGCLAAFGGCALLTGAAACAAVFIFRDALVGVGLQAAGFESEGRTEAIFEQAEAPTPLPQIVQPVSPPSVSVSAGSYGQHTIQNNQGVQVSVGQDEAGQNLATVTSTESDMMNLCRQYSTVCTPQGAVESGYAIRNARIDLKPGGAIVYAEAQPPGMGIWQQAGIVMQVNDAGTGLVVRGVDVNGLLFSSPPPELAVLVDEAESAINDGIRQLAINAQGENYDLQSIAIDDSTMTLLLR